MNAIKDTIEKLITLRFLFITLLIGLLLSHLPFLQADADLSIQASRGTWTDEGLNTCQIRNFVNHNHLNLLDGDNFLKTPLFSFFLLPFFKLIGISILLARLLTTLFCGLFLLVFFPQKKVVQIGGIFMLTTMLLLPIHQYSHLALAEMYANSLIIATVIIYAYYPVKKRWRTELIIYSLLFTSVLFKIQFAYLLLLPLTMKLVEYFQNNRSNETRKELIVRIGITISLFLIILFIWYLPFRNEWTQIAKQQSGGLSIASITPLLLIKNIYRVFLSKRVFVVFISVFMICLGSAIKELRKHETAKEFKTLIIIIICWFVLELHKFGMTYVPVRYFLSLYLSMGLLISTVLSQQLLEKKLKFNSIFLYCFSVLLLMNCFDYVKAFSSRRYSIQYMNVQFKKMTQQNDVVVGPWAPAFTWESKCYSIPVWHRFLGQKDIIKTYHPTYIVSEFDEKDSDSAFVKNKIYLKTDAQLIMKGSIAFWKVNVYKLNNSDRR